LATRRDNGFDAAELLQFDDWSALVPMLERVGADPTTVVPRLAQFIASVLSWNRSVSNLISRSDELRLVSRHVAESIEPAALLRDSGCRRWIDLGSGAGFPALPLALAGVGADWLLVESRRPKVLFLRRMIKELGLARVQVVHARLEDLVRCVPDELPREVEQAGGMPFDGFTSRATMTLGPTLDLAAQCVRPDGHAFLWKGSGRGDEKLAHPTWNVEWTEDGETPLETSPVVMCNFKRNK